MTSLNYNAGAMNALQSLRSVNKGLSTTQSRISTSLKIQSGKDNAAFFSISKTMEGDSGMFKAINDGLSLTKNAVATARFAAEETVNIAREFSERVAFAQGQGVELADVQAELDEMVSRMQTVIDQGTFNGEDLINGTAAVTVVTGVTRSTGTFATTTYQFNQVDLGAIQTALDAIDLTTSTDLQADLVTAETQLAAAVTAATSLGTTEKSIEGQQEFISNLADTFDEGIDNIIGADMEREAARLQALQVQQQLAVQSLSIANQSPQSVLSLFR